MRVEYIKPFVEAAYVILKEVLQTEEIKRGKLSMASSPMQTLGVAAVIGIAGQVEGRVIYDMTKETAMKIASAMNFEELTEFDELVKATIAELANMITGRAVSALNNAGYVFDLTPPNMFTGDNMEVSNLNLETLIIPLETPYGTVNVNVALREKK